jgi:hypothetical protein
VQCVDATRYGMHDLLRAYAAGLAARAETTADAEALDEGGKASIATNAAMLGGTAWPRGRRRPGRSAVSPPDDLSPALSAGRHSS